jgi:uncharacterized protein (UPF0305 family)
MDIERNFILLNVINKLESVQSNSNTSLCITIYATLKEELKIIHNKDNKKFLNNVCDFLILPISDNSNNYDNSNNSDISDNSNSETINLNTQLKKLLIDKNNIEINNICHKILKII